MGLDADDPHLLSGLHLAGKTDTLAKLKTTLFFSNNGSMSPLAGSIRVCVGDMCAGQSVVFPSIPMLPVTDSERQTPQQKPQEPGYRKHTSAGGKVNVLSCSI